MPKIESVLKLEIQRLAKLELWHLGKRGNSNHNIRIWEFYRTRETAKEGKKS